MHVRSPSIHVFHLSYLHAEQVIETVHFHRFLAELLTKSIAEVVGRVGTDDKDIFPNLRPSQEELRMLQRTFDSCTARQQLVVVFPTPPFPPTKIQLSDCCSVMLRREASSSDIVLENV